jgi:hypothetical protein
MFIGLFSESVSLTADYRFKANIVLDIPAVTGDGKPCSVRLCDYASAGNPWGEASGYRVWLPQPFNLSAPFEGISMSHEKH